MIKASTEGLRCSITFDHEHYKEFQTTTGLKQGDELSLLPFNVILEVAIREIEEY